MENELISVIVPVYNVEKYLDRCISSIVDQTYSDLEILLIDDGSTDRSGVICDAWMQKDKRIRVIHKKNGGESLCCPKYRDRAGQGRVFGIYRQR